MTTVIMFVQFFFTIIIGIYFWTQLKSQYSSKSVIGIESEKEIERLNYMRKISLTEPLTEKTRPKHMEEIIGQEDGLKAIKVALCGPNPQHILIYGPPGVGKTAAARLVLEEAKKSNISPFGNISEFIEIDATTLRYDERNIADPLIGSVHDPIYQGAGAYGQAGSPQPKEGAVSKAHGGVLFIDEIGELHGVQINKLLKVLEDRKVTFESAYYSKSNPDIPIHVHDIFENGIPADFRLIGATTRKPEEIPLAIRSRCVEIFFRQLNQKDIYNIIENTIKRVHVELDSSCINLMTKYCNNGREAVMMVETLCSMIATENRKKITLNDVEWVIESGRYSPRYHFEVKSGERIGVVNGLAVTANGVGMVMTIEVTAERVKNGVGQVKCTGIMDSESVSNGNQKLSRQSTAKSAVDNVMSALKTVAGFYPENYNIHINFPGGMMVDGPSAGVAMFCACYSAVSEIPIDNQIAFTGEISIKGEIVGVGGVTAKIYGAKESGVKTVIIPKSNMRKNYDLLDIDVISASNLKEVINNVFTKSDLSINIIAAQGSKELISAESEVKE